MSDKDIFYAEDFINNHGPIYGGGPEVEEKHCGSLEVSDDIWDCFIDIGFRGYCKQLRVDNV
jgi:hypothetical protein